MQEQGRCLELMDKVIISSFEWRHLYAIYHELSWRDHVPEGIQGHVAALSAYYKADLAKYTKQEEA